MSLISSTGFSAASRNSLSAAFNVSLISSTGFSAASRNSLSAAFNASFVSCRGCAASRNSCWKPWPMRRISPTTLPIWRMAGGSLVGPSTIRATSSITRTSPPPRFPTVAA